MNKKNYSKWYFIDINDFIFLVHLISISNIVNNLPLALV
jgi:hypothetical protein